MLLPRTPKAPAIREVIDGKEYADCPEFRAAVRKAVVIKSDWQLKLTVELNHVGR